MAANEQVLINDQGKRLSGSSSEGDERRFQGDQSNPSDASLTDQSPTVEQYFQMRLREDFPFYDHGCPKEGWQRLYYDTASKVLAAITPCNLNLLNQLCHPDSDYAESIDASELHSLANNLVEIISSCEHYNLFYFVSHRAPQKLLDAMFASVETANCKHLPELSWRFICRQEISAPADYPMTNAERLQLSFYAVIADDPAMLTWCVPQPSPETLQQVCLATAVLPGKAMMSCLLSTIITRYETDTAQAFISLLGSECCEQVAKTLRFENDLTILDILLSSDSTLFFMKQLSGQTLCDLALLSREKNSGFIHELFNLTRADYLQLFLDKLDTKLADQFALHRNADGESGLHEVYSYSLSKDPHLFPRFLQCLSPAVRNEALFISNNNGSNPISGMTSPYFKTPFQSTLIQLGQDQAFCDFLAKKEQAAGSLLFILCHLSSEAFIQEINRLQQSVRDQMALAEHGNNGLAYVIDRRLPEDADAFLYSLSPATRIKALMMPNCNGNMALTTLLKRDESRYQSLLDVPNWHDVLLTFNEANWNLPWNFSKCPPDIIAYCLSRIPTDNWMKFLLALTQGKTLLEQIQNKIHPSVLAAILMQLSKQYTEYSESIEANANLNNISALAKEFKALLAAGFSFENHQALFQSLVTQPHPSDSLLQVLALLSQAEWDDKAIFNQHVLVTHTRITLQVVSQLQNSGCSFKAQPYLFTRALRLLGQQQADYPSLIKMIDGIVQLINQHSLAPDQIDEIMVDNFFSKPLLQGPLNKSTATRQIEQVLDDICRTDRTQLRIDYNSAGHYTLQLPEKSPINLSLLIQHANLSQLDLNDELIEKLGKRINDLLDFPIRWLIEDRVIDTPIVALLLKAQQNAIKIYIGMHYLNINQLFRGEPLDTSANRVLNTQPNQNRLCCFLLGCLLNDTANKVNRLINSSKEKKTLIKIANHYQIADIGYLLCSSNQAEFQCLLTRSLTAGLITKTAYDNVKKKQNLLSYLFSSNGVFDRGEELTEEMIARRLANPHVLPALTSVSQFIEGSAFVQEPGTIRTKISNIGYSGVINNKEGEVLIPQGEHMITTQSAEFLVSTLVRSPSLETKNHYWSMLALVEASGYLCAPYKDQSSAMRLQGKTIERPNHDPSHVYRKMLHIEQVVHYFEAFAADDAFKSFCQCLSDEEIEWLRVAAAFSVTGRESEVSAIENLSRYEEFRAASHDHFILFTSKTMDPNQAPMQARMAHIVRYMGNPNYESKINAHADEHERQQRNFYHRLLAIAHDLDLPRCYSVEDYQNALKPCRDLSSPGKQQSDAYTRLIRYAIDLIKTHGGRLSCDILPNDELRDVKLPYQAMFAETSTDLKRLSERTQLVPKPIRVPPGTESAAERFRFFSGSSRQVSIQMPACSSSLGTIF